nr:hypothetical protein CFP56_26089 [Quercus suber]
MWYLDPVSALESARRISEGWTPLRRCRTAEDNNGVDFRCCTSNSKRRLLSWFWAKISPSSVHDDQAQKFVIGQIGCFLLLHELLLVDAMGFSSHCGDIPSQFSVECSRRSAHDPLREIEFVFYTNGAVQNKIKSTSTVMYSASSGLQKDELGEVIP